MTKKLTIILLTILLASAICYADRIGSASYYGATHYYGATSASKSLGLANPLRDRSLRYCII